ncbi:MAG: Dna2/Cas4 domain-containing protein, partial [Tidjanibacter sp.]|nr:Dna2/Cas4 domain-containing protein [Tidjanibacter sp.]
SIGSPILNALADHPVAEYEALEGAKLYEFGRPDHFIPEVENDERILSESIFKTFSPTGKVAVKYNHQRHTDDNDDSAPAPLSPRDHGTLLHRVFEQSATLDDIYSAIEVLVIDGLITPTEGEQLRLNIEQTMATNGEIAEWFDGSWERVLNEREIIYNGKNYRPDRVMIRGGEAVVIDYKFGLNKPDSYKRQIKFYAQLLRQMGYKKVSGYLWYISMGQLDKEV